MISLLRPILWRFWTSLSAALNSFVRTFANQSKTCAFTTSARKDVSASIPVYTAAVLASDATTVHRSQAKNIQVDTEHDIGEFVGADGQKRVYCKVCATRHWVRRDNFRTTTSMFFGVDF
eukprot:2746977-Amphidinium_carterae.1